MVISRVVQGVRRWIGSTPEPNQKKARAKSVSRPEPKTPTVEPLDKHSTEAVATALLDPYVSEEEEAEYQELVVSKGSC